MTSAIRLLFAFLLLVAAIPATARKAPKPAIPPEHRNNHWYRPEPSSDVAIVFVHGIFSDSHECWTSEKNGAYWPEIVRKDPIFNGAGIYLAGYETYIKQRDYGVHEAAAEVFKALERDGVLQKSNIVFICHSTGGIVTRYMLSHHWELFQSKNIGLALYASPTLGSRIADWVGGVAKALNQRLGFQLRRDSELLQNLHVRFKDKLGMAVDISLVGMELCETKGVYGEIVVNCDSAGAYFGAEKLKNCNHFETVKPTAQSDEPNIRLENFFVQRFRPLMARSDSTVPDVWCTSPPDGPATGRIPLVITGEKFRSGSVVYVGGVEAKIEKLTSRTIVANLPADLPAGRFPVRVRNRTSAETASFNFTVHPVLTNAVPITVTVRGGDSLTIDGHGFTSPAEVRICGAPLTELQLVSSRQLTGKVPPRASSGRCDVHVSVAGISAELTNAVRYDPVLEAITPKTIAAGKPAEVTVTGTGFQSDATFSVGGVATGVRYDSASQLTVSVPARDTTGHADVVVTHADGSTTTLPSGLTFNPSIDSVSPANGPVGGGNVVTITGSGFTPATKVRFGDVTLHATYVDPHTLTVSAPAQAAAGTLELEVLNADGTAAVQSYTYDAPEIGPGVS
jgi:hypothetical protein